MTCYEGGVYSTEAHRKLHIRPRVNGQSGTETVCQRAGPDVPKPEYKEGETTSRIGVKVECLQCTVGVDLLAAEGELFEKDQRWHFDERPAEFRSLNAFIQFLTEDERKTFELSELQELVKTTKEPFGATLSELRRLGFRMERAEPVREVRGVGRLKPVPRGAP